MQKLYLLPSILFCSTCTLYVTLTDWNRDWMPGKFPKTQEEREAAAKKYGLRVEDYEPYPDDGEGYGDYPKLPLKSWDGRDPYEDWDVPTLRRNFNEPVMGGWNFLLYLSCIMLIEVTINQWCDNTLTCCLFSVNRNTSFNNESLVYSAGANRPG